MGNLQMDENFNKVKELYDETGENPLYIWFALLLNETQLPEWIDDYLKQVASCIVRMQFEDFDPNNKDVESARYLKRCLQLTNWDFTKLENKTRDNRLFYEILQIMAEHGCNAENAIEIYMNEHKDQFDAEYSGETYIARRFSQESKKRGGKKKINALKKIFKPENKK